MNTDTGQMDKQLVLQAARTVAEDQLLNSEIERLNIARPEGPHGPTGLGLPRPLTERELAAAWRVGSAMKLMPDLTLPGLEGLPEHKPAKPQRNARLHIRVSDEELAAIKQRAADRNMELSDYVRTIALTGGRRVL